MTETQISALRNAVAAGAQITKEDVVNSKKIECPCCGYPHEIAGKIKEARRNKMKKQKMGETPRTDEYLRRRKENGHTVVVSSDFARQLEIELAAAKAELKELKEK